MAPSTSLGSGQGTQRLRVKGDSYTRLLCHPVSRTRVGMARTTAGDLKSPQAAAARPSPLPEYSPGQQCSTHVKPGRAAGNGRLLRKQMSSLCRASALLTKSGQRPGGRLEGHTQTVPGLENGRLQPVKALAMIPPQEVQLGWP